MTDSRTYFRVADDIDENPKMLELSNAAFRLDLHGISYCARRKTDGRVPKRMVPRLLRNATKALAELLEHGRWIDQGTHYEIHDYLEHQRSKTEIEALAKVRREAGKKGGRPKANRKAKGLAKKTQMTDTDTDTDLTTTTVERVYKSLSNNGIKEKDLTPALNLLSERLGAGERITSPLQWTKAVAGAMKATREASERANEPKVQTIDGVEMRYENGKWEEA